MPSRRGYTLPGHPKLLQPFLTKAVLLTLFPKGPGTYIALVNGLMKPHILWQ